jgi:poly-gamma-glutamate synthesis protein (capsule biosynthesis protein)
MSPLTLLGDLAPVGLSALDLAAAAPAGSLVLANLEIPFCAAALPPRPKAGPPLRGDPALLPALAAAWPGLVVSLANNHTMDFGVAGLAATLSSVRAAGLRPFGAGPTLADAAAPLIVDHAGLRLGLLAATDRWFGVADSAEPGVSPLDPSLVDRIRQLRATTDRVIVSVHGGGEMSPWPSPQCQQTLRAFIVAGADVVHAHHPHVPLGWERWHDGWIFYGLGNTLINPALWPQSSSARRSWRVQLDLAHLAQAPQVSEWESVAAAPSRLSASSASTPVTLRCTRPTAALSDPDVTDRNAPLADPALLEGLHQEYAVRLWENFYADRLNPGDTTARRLRLTARTLRDTAFAVFNPARWRRQRRDRGLFHYHLFSAATHSGEIATALGLLHGELPDRRTPRTHALAAQWLPPALFAG